MSGWVKSPADEWEDYYRDTLGGRQRLKWVDNAWEMYQDGYQGVLLRTADNAVLGKMSADLGTVDCLRLANLDPYDFCKTVWDLIASAIKDLVTGDPVRAEDGLKHVAQVEAYMMILRARLTNKTEHQSAAARAEEVSANVLRLINSFYVEKTFGLLDLAENKICEIEEQVKEMREELKEELGDPSRKS